MAGKSSYLISGLAAAALMTVALPAAKGIGTTTQESPNVVVNRAGKGDRVVQPKTIIVKKPAAPAVREPRAKESDKRQIMDGCDPLFSPVTVPALAHVAGRCVG